MSLLPDAVCWHEGMQLLPQHFQLQGLRAEALGAHLAQVRERLDHRCAPLDQWPVLCPELSIGRQGCVLHMSVDFTLIDYASLQLLLDELGEPLLATTLIAPGETEPLNDAEAILERFPHELDAVVDSGACPS